MYILYVCVCICSLLGLGGDQQPQRAPYAEGLADHGLHFGEGSEEQQVLVDGVDLPAHLQAGHLDGQTDREPLFLGSSHLGSLKASGRGQNCVWCGTDEVSFCPTGLSLHRSSVWPV